MSKLIEVVEHLGTLADRRDPVAVAELIAAAGLPAELEAALIAGDDAQLCVASGARQQTLCVLAPPRNNPGRDEEEEEEVRGSGRVRHAANG